MITNADPGDGRSDGGNDSGDLVPQEDGHTEAHPTRLLDVDVAVAHPRSADVDEHLPARRLGDAHLGDLELLADSPDDCCPHEFPFLGLNLGPSPPPALPRHSPEGVWITVRRITAKLRGPWIVCQQLIFPRSVRCPASRPPRSSDEWVGGGRSGRQ